MDQSTTTPNQSVTPNQPTFIDVSYYPGMTVYGMLPARLELKDGRLSLTTVEGTKEEPVYKELFNASVAEVKKVRSMLDEFKVTIGDKTYRMSVAQYSTPIVATGGVVGPGVAAGMYHKSGAPAFLDKLSQQGVMVTRFGYGKLVLISVAASIIFIGAIAGYFALFG